MEMRVKVQRGLQQRAAPARARPLTRFELPLDQIEGAPVGRWGYLAQLGRNGFCRRGFFGLNDASGLASCSCATRTEEKELTSVHLGLPFSRERK